MHYLGIHERNFSVSTHTCNRIIECDRLRIDCTYSKFDVGKGELSYSSVLNFFAQSCMHFFEVCGWLFQAFFAQEEAQ